MTFLLNTIFFIAVGLLLVHAFEARGL